MRPEIEEVLQTIEEEEERRRQEGRPSLLCVGRDGGRLLHLLVLLRKPRHVLEVGLSAGYSTLWIAAALPPEGVLTTVERDGEKIAMAKNNLERAGLLGQVEILEGPALLRLRDVAGPIDMVFLDAAKDEYLDYFRAVEPLLSPEAMVVADNVLSHRQEVEPYLAYVGRHPSFRSFTFPVGNGLEVTLKGA
ncbi:MAG: O-methyltransferase [Bacillota bacterium]|nr:O-methyltransferase [Bacillota bacterium]